uniref:Uncharacterized protein n=1 Tax=Podoviridae sp. ct9A73 TaxID=2825225 RepID=A0A8S5UK37_9CAUD|nr:MAG TPA: hypothetical protein [Podoviridae sp. ct9A73]
MKQKILEVLDKSTNNGMKADEIVTIIEQAITQAQYDMWDMCKADRSRPSINSVDWAVAMIENKLFGRLD